MYNVSIQTEDDQSPIERLPSTELITEKFAAHGNNTKSTEVNLLTVEDKSIILPPP